MAIRANNQQLIQLLNSSVPHLSTLLVTKQWSEAENMFEQQPNLITENLLLLHYTIEQGLLEATSWLLEHDADFEIRAKYLLDDYVANLTPLQAAVEANQFEIARLLIERSADVNAKTTGELEITALHDAAADGYLDLIRLLVGYKADLNAKDNVHSGTPLDWAKAFEQETAVKLLEQLSEGN